MFDVLVYLYENYWRPDACPSHQQLSRKLSAVGFVQTKTYWRNKCRRTIAQMIMKTSVLSKCRATRSKLTEDQVAQLDDDPQQSIDKLDGLLKDLSAAASKLENIKKDKWDSFAQAADQKIDDIRIVQEACDEMLQAMQFLHNEKTKVTKAENNQVRYRQNRAIKMLSSKGSP